MGLFENVFWKKQQGDEPQWDKFKALIKIDKQPFDFDFSFYKIWSRGQIIKEGSTAGKIQARVVESELGKKDQFMVLIKSGISNEICEKVYFDEFITANDRLQLITIPSKSGTSNTAITLFKMTIGATRPDKEFEINEPYCCNLFLLGGVISKVTFSFSYPDKLIEFHNAVI